MVRRIVRIGLDVKIIKKKIKNENILKVMKNVFVDKKVWKNLICIVMVIFWDGWGIFKGVWLIWGIYMYLVLFWVFIWIIRGCYGDMNWIFLYFFVYKGIFYYF